MGGAKFVGPDNAKRVEGWLEYKQEDPGFLPRIEVSGAFDVPFCPADIISFAPGTVIDNAAGTIRLVNAVEPYRDPQTFEMGYRSIPEAEVYVIVPDANESALLVPLDIPYEDRSERSTAASGTVREGETTDLDDLLTRSDLPEEFRQEGLKVVFSGTIGKKPFQYEDLNRLPIQVTKIELTDGP